MHAARIRVLLLADVKKAAIFLEKRLIEDGAAVEVASSAATAPARLRENAFDLCLADLVEVEALQLLQSVRATKQRTPMIFLVDSDRNLSEHRGPEAPRWECLVKPVSWKAVRGCMRRLLPRASRPTRRTLRAADLEIDLERHRVFRRGAELTLSGKQFDLLALLVRAGGKVVSRSHILEEVWGYTYDPGTNIVEVQVAHLRKHLHEPDRPGPIETVRGLGYRLRKS
jgi:DNA-binding response OmpR family regulator